MSIRIKTLLLFASLLLVTVVVLDRVTVSYFERGFGKIETSSSEKNIGRAEDALTNKADQLSTKLSDWASWDDAYEYVTDKNPEFVESNLQNQSLVNLKINYILFYDNNHKLVQAKSVDVNSEKSIPFPTSLQKILSPTDELVTHKSVDSVKQGFIVLPEGVLVLASRPLLNSSSEGPIHGTLIFAQYLDGGAVKELADVSHLKLSYFSLKDPKAPADVKSNAQAIMQHRHISQPLNQDTIYGYGLMSDIYGKPALISRVEQPRTIYKEGQNAIRFFLTGLIIVFSMLCAVALIFIDQLLVRRITSLAHQVQTIDDASNNLMQVKAKGTDEIGRLAQAINTMLQRIFDSRTLAAKNVELTHEVSEATAALEEEQHSLEKKVKERTIELENLKRTLEDQVKSRTEELNNQLAESQHLNQLTVDRELKMVELKEKLAKYEGKSNEAET